MKILTSLILSLFLMTTLSGQQALVMTEIMYNSPGEDLEFLEFYNISDAPLNLDGYSIIEGVLYAFPDTVLAPQTAFVVASDSCKFNVVYRSFLTSPVEEWTGTLNNGGERIVVTDANQNTIIDVTYNDVSPWPNLPDGFGPSLILCDPFSDMTQPDNWGTNTFLPNEILSEGARIFADPNVVGNIDCTETTDFWLSNNNINHYFESSDTIEIPIYRQSISMQTDTVIARLTSVLLSEGLDYEVLSDTLTFAPGQSSPEFFVIRLLDDMASEGFEVEFLDIYSTDGTLLNLFAVTTIVVIDNDGPPTNKLELRGVLENSEVKALELIVKSDLEIGELSNFSLGAANNGNGSDGTEHHLNFDFIPAGECFFIANDTVRLKKFMGFEDGEVSLLEVDNFNFNGNDAIELFEKNQLIDVFGFQNEDGEGTVWEYTDGWAKKIQAGNSTTFDLDNWNYGGVASIDAEQNDSATNPYPLECLPTSVEEVLNVSEIHIFPNPTSGQVTIEVEDIIEEIRITDVMGRVIFQNKHLRTKSSTVDLSAAQAGVYFLNCLNAKGEVSLRLIVE